MSVDRLHAIPRIVEELYAGALDDAAWHNALLRVADFFNASGAMLFAFDPATGAVLREESHRVDPAVVSDYSGYFLPAWLRRSPDKTVAISLLGTLRRGPFDRADVQTLQQMLVSHIARALEIRDRLQAAQVRNSSLVRSLEVFNFGLLVLDGAGTILESNSIAEQLLATADGMRRTGAGSLKLRDPADEQLRRWLAAGIPLSRSDGLLCVQRRGSLPLSLLLTPLPRTQITWLSRDPRWLVLIFDRSRKISASAELLERELAVSSREAQVAARLFEGLSPQQIAYQLQTSPETVRTQLKSIFRKTGTLSQADLVRRIALGPAVRGDPAEPACF